jgi:UDP-2,3-diacylglucosamine pyrophosphatase LpxH
VKNLLVISDIHFCRVRPGGVVGGQRKIAEFLDHHATRRENGEAWRLIINGDLCDLDYQTDSLDDRGPELASVRRFGEVADEFADTFEALARVLNHGNEVVMIPGNHDIDFMWGSVRDALRTRLASLGARPEAIERLSFCDWFYYEKDRIYLEHGHQYEVDTALVGALDPFDHEGTRLRLSLSTHWVAGYCPLIPDLAYQADHTRSFLYYMPMLVTRYGLRAPELLFKYLAFTVNALRDAGPRHGVPTGRHVSKRVALAERTGLSAAKLDGIEKLTAVPRMASRLAIGARLHVLPAFLVPVLLLLGLAAAITTSLPLAVAAGLLLLVAVGSNLLISSQFGKQGASERVVAADLQRLLEVPLVSFGHFHIAIDEPAGNGRYLNSGTWMEPHLPNTYITIIEHTARVLEWVSPRAEQAAPAIEHKKSA